MFFIEAIDQETHLLIWNTLCFVVRAKIHFYMTPVNLSRFEDVSWKNNLAFSYEWVHFSR